MKTQTQYFVDSNNAVIAKGRITTTFIDLIFNDGTRYYSTFSVDLLKSLDIAKVL